jgi:hypothetical protein
MAEFGYQQARAGSNPVKLEAAVSDEIRVKKLRLAKIKKALKRRLTAGTRQRLLEEATTLVGEIGDLRDLDRSLVASIKSGAKHVDPSTGQVPDAGTPDTPDTSSVAADATPVDTGPDQATIDAQNALTESPERAGRGIARSEGCARHADEIRYVRCSDRQWPANQDARGYRRRVRRRQGRRRPFLHPRRRRRARLLGHGQRRATNPRRAHAQ